MVGYAVIVVVEPSNKAHGESHPHAWNEYRRSVASIPGPKIVCVHDLDKPHVIGSFWGEVNSNMHRALGCVGTLVDGAIRDVDEMTNAGFKASARRPCVGHAHVHPPHWNCRIELFGRAVQPGDLIHADKHGFLVIKPEAQPHILEAARFMDANECRTVIAAARNGAGLGTDRILTNLAAAGADCGTNAKAQSQRTGEW